MYERSTAHYFNYFEKNQQERQVSTLGIASVPRRMYGWCCTVHIFSLGGYDATAVILLVTLAGDVESNHGPPKIYTRVLSAPNASPTTKNAMALSYASLAKTGSTLHAKH